VLLAAAAGITLELLFATFQLAELLLKCVLDVQ